MKRVFLTLIVLPIVLIANAQDTTGEIGHWNMNGNTLDVSGNGFNGTASNLTPAAGMDGVMGHGWYFNGVNSYITIPYKPALNVSQFSIVATIRVMGFYTGACQASELFERGTSAYANPGDYYLEITNDAAGYGCNPTVDTNAEDFTMATWGVSGTFDPSSWSAFNYSPYVSENQWYTVVATFNDTVFKIFVNDRLCDSVVSPSVGMSMGSCTDSASIGYDIYDAAAGFPFGFNGVMDDLRIYNRALSDSEVRQFSDTCGIITLEPASVTVHSVGATAIYTASSTIPGGFYQWQQNSGTGFVNLSSAGPYSGVNTPTLTVTGVTTIMNGYLYRCLVSNELGCSDTSAAALLDLALGISNILSNEMITIFPNPARSELTISAANEMIDQVTITNLFGQTICHKSDNSDKMHIDVSALPAGLYFVKVNGSIVKQFLKE